MKKVFLPFFVFCFVQIICAQNAGVTLNVLDFPHEMEIAKETEITVMVNIQPGFSVFADNIDEDGLEPFSLSIIQQDKFNIIETTYPKPRNLFTSFSNRPIQVFNSTIKVKVKIIPIEGAKCGNNLITFRANYQLCNNQIIREPASVSRIVRCLVKEKNVAGAIPYDTSKFTGATFTKEIKSVLKANNYQSFLEKKISVSNPVTALLLLIFAGFVLYFYPLFFPIHRFSVELLSLSKWEEKYVSFIPFLCYVISISVAACFNVFLVFNYFSLFLFIYQNVYTIFFVSFIIAYLAFSVVNFYKVSVPRFDDFYGKNKIVDIILAMISGLWSGIMMSILLIPFLRHFFILYFYPIGNKTIWILMVLFAGFTIANLTITYIFSMYVDRLKKCRLSVFFERLLFIIFGSVLLFVLKPVLQEEIRDLLIPLFIIVIASYNLFFYNDKKLYRFLRILQKLILIIVITFAGYALIPKNENLSIPWTKYSDSELDKAFTDNKPIIIYANSADSLINRKSDSVLSAPATVKMVSEHVCLKIDIKDIDSLNRVQLLRKFRIQKLPAIIFLNKYANEVDRKYGLCKTEELIESMKK